MKQIKELNVMLDIINNIHKSKNSFENKLMDLTTESAKIFDRFETLKILMKDKKNKSQINKLLIEEDKLLKNNIKDYTKYVKKIIKKCKKYDKDYQINIFEDFVRISFVYALKFNKKYSKKSYKIMKKILKKLDLDFYKKSVMSRYDEE